MITPVDIREKCLRIWQSDAFWVDIAQGGDFRPIEIPFGKPSPKEMLNDFSTLDEQLAVLRRASKEHKGYGYGIDYTEINHRQLGSQRVPARIYFETADDFLRYVGKKKEFDTFQELAAETQVVLPGLSDWVSKNPHSVIANSAIWHKLLAVCRYFQETPSPRLYLRQLDVPKVDTKFIESNKTILRSLLDEVLPKAAVDRDVTKLSEHGFERRYRLLYEEPQVRFRILDKDLAYLGMTDLTIPVSQFNSLDFPAARVFFTENKTNVLCFPDVKESIAIFGGGYGIGVLKAAEWLRRKEIYYWGDIDTHAFSILSQLRGYFPHVHSILMDVKTLETFKELWGEEEEEKRCLIELTNLTHDEWQLYSDLRDNVRGDKVRLEQERIGFRWVLEVLSRLPEVQSPSGLFGQSGS